MGFVGIGGGRREGFLGDSHDRSAAFKGCSFGDCGRVGVDSGVIVAKVGTEGGWMECVSGHGGIGTVVNGFVYRIGQRCEE